MQTPLPASARLTMPMVLAVLVLSAGAVAIAWTVQWATAGSDAAIGQATAAGAAAISLPLTNQAAGALPAFTLVISGSRAYDPEPVGQGWADPQPLDRMGEGMVVYVWMDWWFACLFITDDYEYKPVGMADGNPQDTIDMAKWDALTFRQQQQVKGRCDQ